MPVGEDVLWHHRALCRLALPLRAPSRGTWQREAAGATLHMEAAEGGTLPAGRMARLLLLAICDAARRADSVVVELGEDPAAVARRVGLESTPARLRELAEQLQRLVGARLTVSWDGGPTLSVFDARGRAHAQAGGWRSSVRLTARLKATLAENAVALSRPVVLAVADSPLAFDLYVWLAASLPQDGAVLAAPVAQLQAQFSLPSQASADFVAALEAALAKLRSAWPALEAATGAAEWVFREAPAAAPEPAPQPEPVAPQPEASKLETQEPEAPALSEPAEAEDEDELDLEAMLNAEAEARAASLRSAPAPQPEPLPEPLPRAQAVARLEPEADPVPTEWDEPAREQVEPVREQAVPAREPRQKERPLALKSHLTGLPQVIWLERSNGREIPVIEVTPGGRYDPDLSTVIALEPVALQIWGGLYARDFERVAAWAAANRDLIDDFWDSRVTDFEEVQRRVRRVPAPTWR